MIVLVEDNDGLAKIYCRILEVNGFETSWFSRGRAALDFCKTNLPELFIVDLALPDMDGVTFATTIRKWYDFRGPIIAISGALDLMEPASLNPAGFTEMFVKPLKLDTLVDSVRRSLVK